MKASKSSYEGSLQPGNGSESKPPRLRDPQPPIFMPIVDVSKATIKKSAVDKMIKAAKKKAYKEGFVAGKTKTYETGYKAGYKAAVVLFAQFFRKT